MNRKPKLWATSRKTKGDLLVCTWRRGRTVFVRAVLRDDEGFRWVSPLSTPVIGADGLAYLPYKAPYEPPMWVSAEFR